MNYKIVSKNKNLLNKSHHIFNILGFSEAIHTQDVDLWLIDVKDTDNQALTSYKNRQSYAFLLFVVTDSSDIKLCLENNFTNYIDINFSKEELLSWCKFFKKNQKSETINFEDNFHFDLKTNILKQNNQQIDLTNKELFIIKELLKGEFIQTQKLMLSLKLSSKTSIRTIVNRIRNKTNKNFIEQKRGFGYKLKLKEKKEDKNLDLDSYIKEIEEQNQLMQQIIDSSPIFIVTFIHKQLYCINESFREYLGREIIKELWDEEKGDFFQLIKHKTKEKEILKDRLFTKGTHHLELLDLNDKNYKSFKIQTLYFENLDKHLLVFKPQS